MQKWENGTNGWDKGGNFSGVKTAPNLPFEF
jgi:hypothetical protein